MVNKPNLAKLIDAIENGIPGVYFNMTLWHSRVPNSPHIACNVKAKEANCNTIACIGGHTGILSGEDSITAQIDWLGVDKKQYDEMCYAWEADDINLDDVTRIEAVKMLRNLYETGVVSWEFLNKKRAT